LTADESARDLIGRYVQALHDGDWDAVAAIQHPDFVEDYPQSGERIRGRQNFRSILENYPGGLVGEADNSTDRVIGGEDRWMISPAFTMVRLSGANDMHTAIVKLRYADGSTWYMVALYELRDGRIARATSYFAPLFDPPPWRREWVEVSADPGTDRG
jgi:ketosteroid isomerase-like protein